MRSGSLWASLGLAAALFAGLASAGAVEVAKPRASSGNVVVERGRERIKVSSTTQFREGDILRVPTDAKCTVEFEDGSAIALIGPADLRFGPMEHAGRRVVLGSGTVSEANVLGTALEIQAPAPYDASFVLQNARGFARVTPGDRIVFQKLSGDYAKAWSGGRSQDVRDEAWMLNVRTGVIAGGPAARAPAAPVRGPTLQNPEKLPGGAERFILGRRGITIQPAAKFKKQALPDGGVRLCYYGDDFGTVLVGMDTVLFLADQQCVEFDANGNVVRFDGISHLYHPLTDEVVYDEPVENTPEASPQNPRVR